MPLGRGSSTTFWVRSYWGWYWPSILNARLSQLDFADDDLIHIFLACGVGPAEATIEPQVSQDLAMICYSFLRNKQIRIILKGYRGLAGPRGVAFMNE